jgi:hypothetical protein
VRPVCSHTRQEHRLRHCCLRQLAIRNQRDRRRRERRLSQEFADGTGVRGVKHRTGMTSIGPGSDVAAVMMPKVLVAMVTVALCAVVMV